MIVLGIITQGGVDKPCPSCAVGDGSTTRIQMEPVYRWGVKTIEQRPCCRCRDNPNLHRKFA